MEPRPPTIEGYRVTSRLGHGGMGDVYGAERTTDGRPVAIKVILADVGGGRNDEVRRRFLREIEISKTLAHPNLVKVVDGGVTVDDRPFLVMERLEGATLAELARPAPLDDRVLRRVATDLCHGLDYLHGRGYVHRDIKPSNVFVVADDGRAVLLDFGLAWAPETTDLTATGQALGSVHTMAPEKFVVGDVGPPSDVYELGATLYMAATGRATHDPARMCSLDQGWKRDLPPPPHTFNDAVSPELSRAIMTCLEPDPDDRPPTVWQAFEPILASPPTMDETTVAAVSLVDGPSHSSTIPTARFGDRGVIVAGIVAVALCGAVALWRHGSSASTGEDKLQYRRALTDLLTSLPVLPPPPETATVGRLVRLAGEVERYGLLPELDDERLGLLYVAHGAFQSRRHRRAFELFDLYLYRFPADDELIRVCGVAAVRAGTLPAFLRRLRSLHRAAADDAERARLAGHLAWALVVSHDGTPSPAPGSRFDEALDLLEPLLTSRRTDMDRKRAMELYVAIVERSTADVRQRGRSVVTSLVASGVDDEAFGSVPLLVRTAYLVAEQGAEAVPIARICLHRAAAVATTPADAERARLDEAKILLEEGSRREEARVLFSNLRLQRLADDDRWRYHELEGLLLELETRFADAAGAYERGLVCAPPLAVPHLQGRRDLARLKAAGARLTNRR